MYRIFGSDFIWRNLFPKVYYSAGTPKELDNSPMGKQAITHTFHGHKTDASFSEIDDRVRILRGWVYNCDGGPVDFLLSDTNDEQRTGSSFFCLYIEAKKTNFFLHWITLSITVTDVNRMQKACYISFKEVSALSYCNYKAECVLESMAKLHAHFWNTPQSDEPRGGFWPLQKRLKYGGELLFSHLYLSQVVFFYDM